MQRYSILLFIILALPLHFLHAQTSDSTPVYTTWQLDEKTHQLLMPELPKKLDKNLKILQINYQEGESRLTDFYTLGEAQFYQKRKNPFRINKTRYSGTLVGIDEDEDICYQIEFLKGKLDGYFIVYQTDGAVITSIFEGNQLKSKTIQTPEETPETRSGNPYIRKLRKIKKKKH